MVNVKHRKLVTRYNFGPPDFHFNENDNDARASYFPVQNSFTNLQINLDYFFEFP